MRKRARGAGRFLVATILVLAIGIGVGAAFVWLFAPKPTIWNSSPPPEPFLFIEGFMLWLFVCILYIAGRELYRKHRHRFARPS